MTNEKLIIEKICAHGIQIFISHTIESTLKVKYQSEMSIWLYKKSCKRELFLKFLDDKGREWKLDSKCGNRVSLSRSCRLLANFFQ